MSEGLRAELMRAVAPLWELPAPGPPNLLVAPAFVHLRDTCHRLYPSTKSKDALAFALSNALRGLGLPCTLTPANAAWTQPLDVAVAALDTAFRQTRASRVYLCPLDMAADLPAVVFGPNRTRTFTSSELSQAVDLPRLERINPHRRFDATALSQFNWLVVEEAYALDREPGQRTIPLLFEMVDLNRDWGRIEPYSERYPRAVEAALFAILRAPWEDWVDAPEVGWRAFRVPWVYTADTDLFIRPPAPAAADTLSWDPDMIYDYEGNLVEETERPIRLPLKDTVSEASAWVNDESWATLTQAHRSPLFETPVAHFFVHAFLAEGALDEFLAHITTIEAALGLRSDYGGRSRTESGVRIKLRATERVATRVSVLLGDKAYGGEYSRLFEHRSTFLHGRRMEAIPGTERIVARRLARLVVNRLVEAAVSSRILASRETYLDELLDRAVG
jgi:hypothetical protein